MQLRSCLWKFRISQHGGCMYMIRTVSYDVHIINVIPYFFIIDKEVLFVLLLKNHSFCTYSIYSKNVSRMFFVPSF